MGRLIKEALVEWAKPNQWIPIRCSKCGALFSTKNYSYAGAKPVIYAIDYSLHPNPEEAKSLSYARAQECTHDRECWYPDYEVYESGKW